jgi:hypothetical protein
MGFLLGDAGVQGDLVGKAGSCGVSLGVGYCLPKFCSADGGLRLWTNLSNWRTEYHKTMSNRCVGT